MTSIVKHSMLLESNSIKHLLFEKEGKSFGFTLEDRNGHCTVASLDRGPSGYDVNEAERLGAAVGDVVLKVNGKTIVGMPFQQIITEQIKNACYPITMILRSKTETSLDMQQHLQQLKIRHLTQVQQHQQHQKLLVSLQQQQSEQQEHQHKSDKSHNTFKRSTDDADILSGYRPATRMRSICASSENGVIGQQLHRRNASKSLTNDKTLPEKHDGGIIAKTAPETVWEAAVRAKASGFVSTQARHVTNAKVQDDALTEIGARMVSRILRREKLRREGKWSAPNSTTRTSGDGESSQCLTLSNTESTEQSTKHIGDFGILGKDSINKFEGGSIHEDPLYFKTTGTLDPLSSKVMNTSETAAPFDQLSCLGIKIKDDMQALKLEYDKICERKEDLKFKYREANKHFGDLSKVCMGEAAVIKQRIERVHQRIQATDTTIEQMRRKFDHLDNVVKTNSKSEFIDSNRDAAETSQEMKRFIVSISHTQIHRDNLDKEYTNLNQKLQQQTEQSNVFHNRHKQRVEIMTSICEQFDWELKIVHQHMVQLDKLRKIIDTEVSV